jgi:hypothetical protein
VKKTYFGLAAKFRFFLINHFWGVYRSKSTAVADVCLLLI